MVSILTGIQQLEHKTIHDLASQGYKNTARLTALPVSFSEPLIELIKIPVRAVYSLFQGAKTSFILIAETVCPSPAEAGFRGDVAIIHTYLHVDDIAEEISLIPLRVLRTPFLVIGNLYSLLKDPLGNVTCPTATQRLEQLQQKAKKNREIALDFNLSRLQESFLAGVEQSAKGGSTTKARLAAIPVSILDPAIDLFKIPLRAISSLGNASISLVSCVFGLAFYPLLSERGKVYFNPATQITYTYIHLENIVKEVSLIPLRIARTPLLILGNLYSLEKDPKNNLYVDNQNFYTANQTLEKLKNYLYQNY